MDQTKVFNGMKYEAQMSTPSHQEAVTFAARLRKKGHHARVVQGELGHHFWVYSRTAGSKPRLSR
jgi:hypothetical protein